MSQYKMPAWSYTALTAFETCPKRYFMCRVSKEIADPPGEAALWGQRVHSALEHRVKDGTPLPKGMEHWEPLAAKFDHVDGKKLTETKMCLNASFKAVTWFDKAAWLRGVIDVGVIRGERAVLADWKTGKRQPDNDQLKLFAAMGFCQWPYLKSIATSFIWLKDNKTDRDKFEAKDAPLIWQDFMPRVQRMELAFKRNGWPAKPSGLCSKWCPVPKSKCQFSGKEG